MPKMADLIDLLEGRTALEQQLRSCYGEDSSPVDIELTVYDLMTESTQRHQASFQASTAFLRKRLEENVLQGVSDLSREQEFEAGVHEIAEKFGHRPAYLVVVNYDPAQHADHIFGADYKDPLVGMNIRSPEAQKEFLRFATQDRALLVDAYGKVVGVKAHLVNINPADIPDARLTNGNGEDPTHDRFGFPLVSELNTGYDDSKGDELSPAIQKKGANTRHYSAISASYHMAGAVVYTLSEETRGVRRFRDGKITFSTHPLDIVTEA